MLKIEDIECSGCGACFNVCPHKAIAMTADAEGFLFPKIDTNKCIKCGLCAKVCPVLHPNYDNQKSLECFAAMADDKLRSGSSSGAVFPLLAQTVLEKGGCVCGAAFADDKLSVEHILINKSSDLIKLKGSKYLQSNTKDCYRQIKTLLQAGKTVLFTGTPCQVAGLKGFLQKDYENLLCVDIICHGTPSPKVYRKYISELGLKGKPQEVNFRDKKYGWGTTNSLTITTSEEQYSCLAKDDIFMQFFLQNLCLRKSCGQCPFNKMPRQGDLTIGDFWGVTAYKKSYDDKKGTSVILVNNEKGKKALENIADKFKLLKSVEFSYAVAGNPNLASSSKLHNARDIFFANLDKMSLKENKLICEKEQDKSDVAILNLWWSLNYGAILTAYALQQQIEEWGYSTRLVTYIHDWCKTRYKGSFSEKFANRYLNITTNFESYAELVNLNEKVNSFVVGSDQVFRPNSSKSNGFYFYLPFVRPDKKKIACAASFATPELEADVGDKNLIKQYLSCFDAISVRENNGVDICRELGSDAIRIADPVFWLSAQKWSKLADSVNRTDTDFGLVYVLDKEKNTLRTIEALQKKLSISKIISLHVTDNGISPEEWLYNFKNCSYVITDSFHGVCFAIIFNKPFVCIANIKRGLSRFESLLSVFGLTSRMLFNTDKIDNRTDIFEPIDYQAVNSILEQEVKYSVAWLKQELKMPKRSVTTEDILNYRLNQKDWLIFGLEQRFNDMGRLMIKSGLLRPYKLRCILYSVLAALTCGKLKKKYKNKKKKYKQKIKDLKKRLRGE